MLSHFLHRESHVKEKEEKGFYEGLNDKIV